MSAEATSATGTLLLAQDTAKELLALQREVRELRADIEAKELYIARLESELARKG